MRIGSESEDNDDQHQGNKEIATPGRKMEHRKHEVIHSGLGLDSSLNQD